MSPKTIDELTANVQALYPFGKVWVALDSCEEFWGVWSEGGSQGHDLLGEGTDARAALENAMARLSKRP